mmetsp:Transcript_11459/g.36500  ORF Transcript_11459/g.36500 Transcript_11459/m.36500 type:complete len:190 (+) Transcript_11459:788-1357(+)
MPGLVHVILERGGILGSRPSKELVVCTKNPEEAMFEHVEMFREHCYGPLEDDSGAWGLRTGDGDEPLIVVDAGMNLGLFCIYLQRHLCNSAQSRPVICLAFEPAPESYEIAVRNLRDAGVRTVDHGARMPETGQAIGNLAPGSLEVHAFLPTSSGPRLSDGSVCRCGCSGILFVFPRELCELRPRSAQA